MPTTTPDTTAYLILALILFFGIMLLFVGTLVLRVRSLHKDDQLLDQLED